MRQALSRLEYVGAFIDTSVCERFSVFTSSDNRFTTQTWLILRTGIPDGDTIVRADSRWIQMTSSPDLKGALVTWDQAGELIAPRPQPVIFNNTSAAIHVNKA